MSGDSLTSSGVSDSHTNGGRANGVSKTPVKGEGVHDDKRGENGDGNWTLPQTVGSNSADKGEERGANGNGSCHTNGNGISFPSAADPASPSHDGEQQQRENGVSSSSRSGVIPSPLPGVTGAPATSTPEDVGFVDSSDTRQIACEAPFDESKAVLKAGTGIIDEEQEVGPAREPTEQEAKALADLVRRAHSVPLRLDARERWVMFISNN